MAMQTRSRPTTGAIGGLRKGCPDGPKRRYRVPGYRHHSRLVVTWYVDSMSPDAHLHLPGTRARAPRGRRDAGVTRGARRGRCMGPLGPERPCRWAAPVRPAQGRSSDQGWPPRGPRTGPPDGRWLTLERVHLPPPPFRVLLTGCRGPKLGQVFLYYGFMATQATRFQSFGVGCNVPTVSNLHLPESRFSASSHSFHVARSHRNQRPCLHTLHDMRAEKCPRIQGLDSRRKCNAAGNGAGTCSRHLCQGGARERSDLFTNPKAAQGLCECEGLGCRRTDQVRQGCERDSGEMHSDAS